MIASASARARWTRRERLGAVAAFDVAEIENPVTQVRELTEGGRGADAVIEAVGRAADLGVGAADGAQGRHRESVWRVPDRERR